MAAEVLSIEPKDITIVLRLDYTEVKKVRDALDIAELHYDYNNKELSEAATYLKDRFFPFLEDIIRRVEGNGN